MTIKVAVIGVAHWHGIYDAAYLRHLVAMPDVEVVGVQDRDVAVARQRAQLAADVAAFSDYRAMIETTTPDFVVALGPHDGMAETAHYLLDNGLPFLMEKPLGLTAAEVETIADKASKQRAFVAVPLAQRRIPEVERMRRMVEDGFFDSGPAVFRYRFVKSTPIRYADWDSPWMLDPAVAGGGCLRNFGIHGMDLLWHLTGEPAEVVGAAANNLTYGLPIEDHAVVVLKTPAGATATVDVGYTLPAGKESVIEVGGRGGWLRFDGQALTVQDGAGTRVADVAARAETPHQTILRESLACWRSGQPPPVGVADCLRAVRLVDDAYSRIQGAT
jgi:predicted dehydrogenase